MRCIWLSTSVEDAQVNAVSRIVSRYGRLLEPDEMQTISKRDVAAFGPAVQFRYQRELEPPDSVGRVSREIDVMPFDAGTRRVVRATRPCFLWCDGVLRGSRSGGRTPCSADDVEVLGGTSRGAAALCE